MSSTTVKCTNCNVVINELLAFLANVLDYMDEESIHQLVTSSFSGDKIATAKTLLFDSLPKVKKMPQRRGDGKKRMSRDLDDIICRMKSVNAELLPIFVAKDLHLVPSVGFDHIDCTRLLKDIASLQRQVHLLQEKSATMEMFDLLKLEFDNMKHASVIDNYPAHSYVNKRRGACLQDSDSYDLNSGPMGLQYVPIKSAQPSSADKINGHSTPTLPSANEQSNTNSVSFQCAQSDATESHRPVEAPTLVSDCTSEKYTEERRSRSAARTVSEMEHHSERVEAADGTAVSKTPVIATCANADFNTPNIIAHNQTAVSLVGAVTRSSNDLFGSRAKDCTQVPELPNNNNEWQIVQSKNAKRYKLIGQRGRASTAPDVRFKAADFKIPLFISNVSKETSEQDIISYIQDRTNEIVSLKLINMKSVRKYNAYKLFVTKSKLNLFLNDEFWPDGITFRRFVQFRYGNKQERDNVIANK